jgi:hypothetical protein
MRPHVGDTAASYRAAVNLFRDGAWTDEERAHLARLEAHEAAIRRTVDRARRNRAAERSNPTAARAA